MRHGLHKLADRIVHPVGRETIHKEVIEVREKPPRRDHYYHHQHIPTRHVGGEYTRGATARTTIAYTEDLTSNTVTIPCHHIRIGDILMLQGHPCQIIRISSSAATGQHRYLGVDLFTKQLHEESSQIHNPAPSVVVQTMRGPIQKQYRVLDLQDGNGEFILFLPSNPPMCEQQLSRDSMCSRRHDRDR